MSELPEWKTWSTTYPTINSYQSLVPSLDPDGVQLLESMIIYNPNRRITAQEALHHRFFDDLGDAFKVGDD